ncbi:MAG: flagellar basal body rod protein FlgC [Pseudomonadota bacterium]
MVDFESNMSATIAALNAQTTRLRLASENLANADTPGYRRKTVSFEGQMQGTDPVLGAGRIRLDPSELQEIYDPNHPLADARGTVQGSNVNMLVELADAREAQRSYEANLKMFDQARSMASSLIALLRR